LHALGRARSDIKTTFAPAGEGGCPQGPLVRSQNDNGAHMSLLHYLKSVNFDSFTPSATDVVLSASVEAADREIAPEHLLIGLLAIGKGGGYEALREAGLSAEAVRQKIHRQAAPGAGGPAAGLQKPRNYSVSRATFSPAARSALRNAIQQAKRLKHGCVGTEHLALALLEESGGRLSAILDELNINRSQCQERIRRSFE